MTENQLVSMLEKIQSLAIPAKEIMTINDCAIYTGLSTSYLYKLTSKKEIPFFKPMGKRVYFKRTEIDQWLLRNKQGGIYEAS
ncbi:helix-turn-helix transcriptional regulator [Gynuella sp.]|uniref:helix-turn-helix transcriptional regulator n=1 Tax=Gynuella sp. TaxID=2969146 RepID=UPI003D0B372A